MGLSKYHLQRLFQALTNKSLMSYVRGRRLTLSLHDLIRSNIPFVAYSIPTQVYAVFRYVGFHSLMNITYKALKEHTDHWFFRAKHKKAQPYHFERLDLTVCSESYCEMDIYMPIRVISV